MAVHDRFGYTDPDNNNTAEHDDELPWLQSASRSDEDDNNEPFIPRSWVLGLAGLFLVAFVAVAGIVYRMAQERSAPPTIHINPVLGSTRKAPATSKPDSPTDKSDEHAPTTASPDEDLEVTGTDSQPVLAQTVVNSTPNSASAPRETTAEAPPPPSPQPRPKAVAAVPTPPPAPAPVPTPKPKAVTPPPVVAPAPHPPAVVAAPAPAPAKPVTLPPGIYVQLGAFSSQARAQAAWNMFSGKHGALQGHSPVIQPAGAAFRLRTGPISSKADADQLCASLKAEGQSCIIAQ